MPFIRLSDNYIDNPKIGPLSDAAFRLWHQALAYCRRHQTDGLIPKRAMLDFSRYSPKRLEELTCSREGRAPLVSKVDAFGFQLHDYLQWNPSRDEENERRGASKDRMRDLRDRRRTVQGAPGTSIHPARDAVTPPSRAPHVTEPPQSVTSRAVLDRERKRACDPERGSGGKPAATLASDDELASRAGRLLLRYQDLFAECRHGAKTRLIGNSLEFYDAESLCQLWDDARLEKLARIVLTTDDEFIAKTDRSFKIFALKASWADDRLRAWEREQGIAG